MGFLLLLFFFLFLFLLLLLLCESKVNSKFGPGTWSLTKFKSLQESEKKDIKKLKKKMSNSRTNNPNESKASLMKKFLFEVSADENEDLEYEEKEEVNNITVLLRSRKEILCYKFIENIRKKLEKKKDKNYNNNDKKKKKIYLTKMISVSDKLSTKVPKKEVIDDLDKYIESLNLNEDDLYDIGMSSSSSLDLVLGTHWKETVTVNQHSFFNNDKCRVM